MRLPLPPPARLPGPTAKAAKNKNKQKTSASFFRRKKQEHKAQGGRYCKTRDRTGLIVDGQIDTYTAHTYTYNQTNFALIAMQLSETIDYGPNIFGIRKKGGGNSENIRETSR
jgi:hypothetical protein